ncbi:MAG: hypothetical protein IKC77_08870 [Lentisphaeria bacterium]|nr:hypothetical protein [Lentisphaeria bacterium]
MDFFLFSFVPEWGDDAKESVKTSFHEKRIFPSLPAPLSPFQEKRGTFLFDKVLIYVKYVKDWGCGKTQNGLFASADAV